MYMSFDSSFGMKKTNLVKKKDLWVAEEGAGDSDTF